MRSVQMMLSDLADNEGASYVDGSPPSKYGLTLPTLQSEGLDLNRDGKTDERDLMLINAAQAESIMLRRYYYDPRLHLLEACMSHLNAAVFDTAVNMGPNTAIMLLQRTLSLCGATVEMDAIMGPDTLAAALSIQDQPSLLHAYCIERRSHYIALAANDSGFVRYVVSSDGGKGGWIRRAELYLDPKYRATDEEWADVVDYLQRSSDGTDEDHR